MKLSEVITLYCQSGEDDELGMGPKTPAANLRFASKDGRQVNLKKLLVEYKKAVKNGWSDYMQAKAPPGWSDENVEGLDKSGGVSNPWALAWWLKNERGVNPSKSSNPAVRKRARKK